ncbi:MAG: hypothetical protein QXJ17_08660 [Nitrososphaeria archaeon]
MKKSKRWSAFPIISLILLSAVLLTVTPVNAASVSIVRGPEKISTGGDEETPQIAVDSNGNVHVIWASYGASYLYYKMMDSNGNVLIDETNLNPCLEYSSYHVRRPSMVIDSNNNVHIVFHGFDLYTEFGEEGYGSRQALAESEVVYIKINPYLDNRDGTPADVFTITVIPETIISTVDSTRSRAPNIAIDPYDRLHVTWFDGNSKSSLQIHYLVMDTDGTPLFEEATLTTGLHIDVDWGEPEIAADSNGNAHIIYCTDTWDSDREIYYTMINGSTGNTLIDETRITSDDGHSSVRAFLAVDHMNMVHVAWHDRRFYDAETGEHEIFYSKLNPSLDDQSGDAADPDVISVVSEQLVSSNDGYKSYLCHIAVDSGNKAHIVWVDLREGAEAWGEGEVYYAVPGAVPETRLTHFDGTVYPAYWWYSSGRYPDIAVVSNRVYITFNGYIQGEEETSDIYLMILSTIPRLPTKVSVTARGSNEENQWVTVKGTMSGEKAGGGVGLTLPTSKISISLKQVIYFNGAIAKLSGVVTRPSNLMGQTAYVTLSVDGNIEVTIGDATYNFYGTVRFRGA